MDWFILCIYTLGLPLDHLLTISTMGKFTEKWHQKEWAAHAWLAHEAAWAITPLNSASDPIPVASDLPDSPIKSAKPHSQQPCAPSSAIARAVLWLCLLCLEIAQVWSTQLLLQTLAYPVKPPLPLRHFFSKSRWGFWREQWWVRGWTWGSWWRFQQWPTLWFQSWGWQHHIWASQWTDDYGTS